MELIFNICCATIRFTWKAVFIIIVRVKNILLYTYDWWIDKLIKTPWRTLKGIQRNVVYFSGRKAYQYRLKGLKTWYAAGLAYFASKETRRPLVYPSSTCREGRRTSKSARTLVSLRIKKKKRKKRNMLKKWIEFLRFRTAKSLLEFQGHAFPLIASEFYTFPLWFYEKPRAVLFERSGKFSWIDYFLWCPVSFSTIS